MPMTLQEISDRFEIMDLETDYCAAIDTNNIEALDTIFTKDALIDYSKAGGPKTDLETIKKFLKANLGVLPRQHSISNYKITITGDRAKVICLCINPLELPSQGDGKQVAIWGIWYHDTVVRTSEGWRIKEKITHPCYSWKLQTIDF